jgi:hypothetical protein
MAPGRLRKHLTFIHWIIPFFTKFSFFADSFSWCLAYSRCPINVLPTHSKQHYAISYACSHLCIDQLVKLQKSLETEIIYLPVILNMYWKPHLYKVWFKTFQIIWCLTVFQFTPSYILPKSSKKQTKKLRLHIPHFASNQLIRVLLF